MSTEVNLPDSFFKELLQQYSPNCFLLIDSKEYKVKFCNELFAKFVGCTQAVMDQGDFSFIDLLDGSHQERFKIQLKGMRHHELKRSRYVVHDLKTKEGKVQRFYIYSSTVPGKQDTPEFYQMMLIPEYSNWQLPFTSFDTREMFLELFSTFGFGTFEWVIDTDKLYWSEGIYEIYEFEKNKTELNAEFVRTFLHPEDRRVAAAAMQRTLNTGLPYDLELRVITPKKNLKYINTIGRLLKDDDGKPIKIIGSIKDITQQKESEAVMKRHMTELNRSNRELEEFAYITSHDLQEPLRKVSTFSDRLYEKVFDDLDDDGKFYLQRIIAAASNMRQLINNLLDFSRVTKGNLSFSNTDLNFILKEVRSDLELKISETEATITSDALPAIEADPLQMRQLFLNLLNNALKFRKEDVSPVINISCSELDPEEKVYQNMSYDTKYYKIRVTDNGIGFEEEYATRIFQIFQRLHGKAEYPGSGIGLAICKKIVDHHQGMIYAEGIAGEGATFTIILPEKQI